MPTLRILLVDDHELVRLGLRMVLEPMQGLEIVGEAASAEEAIVCCETLQPDVVIMDIRMPGASGVDACREIVKRWSFIQVIMLTSYSEDSLIIDAIQAGAVGYVLKDVEMTELIRALTAVRQGTASLDPAITRRLLSMIRQQKTDAFDPFHMLTEREVEVLKLVAAGRHNTEIAAALVVSDKTVRNYISTILDKLNVTNRAEAAAYAQQNQIDSYQRN
jgi:two-component system, NarL family, response regulator DevR